MGRPWWYVSVAGCLMLSGLARAAGAGDAQAMALVRDAMDRDFIAAQFDGVQDKLRQAEAICKKPGCSPAVAAQVHGYLGVLEGSAHKSKPKAIEEFRQMLRIDFTSTLDNRYASPNLRDAFDIAKEDVAKELEPKREADAVEAKKAEEARKVEAKKAEEAGKVEAKKAEEAAKVEAKKAEEARKVEAKKAEEVRKARLKEPPPVGKLIEKPFTEQAVSYPLPVLVKIPAPPEGIEPERTTVAKVVADYTGPGGQRGRVVLKPLKDGYAGEIPCAAVQAAGKLTYFTTALNKLDQPVASGGTSAAPHTVVLKVALYGAMPHLPGELPPTSCVGGSKQGACKVASDCGSEGLQCVKGECTVQLEPSSGPTARVKKKGMCGACRVGADPGPEASGLFAALGMLGALVVRRLRRMLSREC